MTDHRPSPNVVIDGFALSSAGAGSGVGTYTRHLLGALHRIRPGGLWALATPEAPLPPGVERLTVDRRARRARLEVIEHAARLPVDLARRRPSGAVFHNPGFHAPFGVRGPWVQTLLDVIPLVLDHRDLAALRSRWKRFGPRYAKADAVIAISAHAAAEGIRLLGLDPARVTIAPLGVDPSFTPGSGRADPPYVLMVGEYSRRKGFDRAFGVLDDLAERGYPHRLKVVGRVHDWGRAEVDALRSAARHPERIELCGFVPDLVGLYQAASVVVVTSRYEGFGLPALEAMACGTPVVAFANSAVTEVVTDGGVLVADGDVAAMVTEVRRLIDDERWADEWRQRGVERAATFTWARSAAIHAEVYGQVAESSRP
ncbi:MAG: glycosyltransferase family 4 protein [Acidimicrobiales bacterium]